MSLTKAEARRLMADVAFRSGESRAAPPTFCIYGDITLAMADRVEEQMSRPMSGGDIVVLIDSRGGLDVASQRIFTALRAHHGRVATKALGLCCSAAIKVLLAGDTREARPATRFLLHNVEVVPDAGDGVRWTAETYTKMARALEKADVALAEAYAERTGRPAARFRSEMADENGIDAHQAMAVSVKRVAA